MKRRVSFIVVEYNSLDEIKSFIDSLDSCSNLEYEVIVSSNSLYDEITRTQLQKQFLAIKWIFNDHNGGFAYAMNRGLEYVNGDFLIITNPDVKVLSGLQQMIDFLGNNPQIGAVGPRIVNDNNELQDSYREYITLPKILLRTFKRLICHKKVVLDKYKEDSVQTVDWVIGAFIMIRKEIYLKVGGLDEKYFLYCEDMDWCTRVRQSGHEVVYYPETVIIYEGTRAARSSLKYARIFLKSLFRYWGKFGCFSIFPKRKEIIYKINK